MTMKILAKNINSFKDSEKPEYRQFYLKRIKEVIRIGEKLSMMTDDNEIENSLNNLKKIVKEYKVYPQITID